MKHLSSHEINLKSMPGTMVLRVTFGIAIFRLNRVLMEKLELNESNIDKFGVLLSIDKGNLYLSRRKLSNSDITGWKVVSKKGGVGQFASVALLSTLLNTLKIAKNGHKGFVFEIQEELVIDGVTYLKCSKPIYRSGKQLKRNNLTDKVLMNHG